MSANVVGMPEYRSAVRTTTYQEGLEFQDFVCEQLAKQRGFVIQNLQSKRFQYTVGENLQGAEIKLDRECTRYHRLSIEVAEKTQADPARPWVDSGIMRPDASWFYVQGNYEILFVFGRNWLRNYFEAKRPPVHDKFGTIRTFYVSFNTARRHAIGYLEFPTCRA